MNTQISSYNSFETTSPIDLWQLRVYLSAELSQCTSNAVSFDFLSEDNRKLKANIEALLSIELKGWDMHNPPSLDERKKFILDVFGYGFPVHIIYSVQHSLLKQALEQNNLEMFEFLLSCGEISAESKIDCEFLLEQILDHQHAIKFIDVLFACAHLHQINIHINKKNADGYAPLMRGVLNHDTEVVERLITTGASLEEVSGEGETALLIAAREYNLDLVKRLVEGGAKIKATSNNGSNLCSIAYEQSNHDEPGLLHYLIKLKRDTVFDDCDGVPILVHAIEKSYDISIIQLLITEERINKACPETGNTPLITAYLNDELDYEYNEFNDELIELLLNAGANPMIKNDNNQTAINMVKARYNERDEHDDEAGNYDDDIEEQVNKLVFKSHEMYTAQDILLEDKAENYKAKLKLKSQALAVLKEVGHAIEEDYKKAQFKRSTVQLEIASIYRDKFILKIDDDLEKVIAQFGKLTCVCMENYKHAQFETASLLILVAGCEQKNGVEHRALLTRALKHADNAQDASLSNSILGDLRGQSITDTTMCLPTNNYERINFFTRELHNRDLKISALEEQLTAWLKQSTSHAASLSGLIRKRSDSPVFSAMDSEGSSSSSKKPCLDQSMP
ncbi:MAG: hypothetical protein P1U36_09595 [Legionellaceae bacterium]|nr:hypothetical protein [Legionellaceae bacterium]